MKYDNFSIKKNDKLVAPEGMYLTMLVDGNEKAIKAGKYRNIEFVVTKECVVSSLDVKNGGTLVGEISENEDGTLTVSPKKS